MTAADEAYDRLHGVDGYTQGACICPRTDGYRIKRRGCPAHAEKDATYWQKHDDRKFGTESPHEPSDEFVVKAFAEGARSLWPDSRDPGWEVTFRRWLDGRAQMESLERTRETFALGAAWALGDDEGTLADLRDQVAMLTEQRDRAEQRHERLESAVEALANEWVCDYPGPDAACSRTPDEWGSDLRALLPGGAQ